VTIINKAETPEQLVTSSLRMRWSAAPWDEAVCGFPVLQITAMEVHGPNAGSDMQVFERERERLRAGLVSCRLQHERVTESMLLEDHGFRFIEMGYLPELDLSNLNLTPRVDDLAASRAQDDDLPDLVAIAGASFLNERFKMDPRLDPAISDRRYQNWVASSFDHPTQELYVIRDGDRRVAFFVTELLDDRTCYWHLNAVAPGAQGLGYGRRVWLTMLNHAASHGAHRVRTSIVARNHRVLNLYARLGFRFPPPSMTFHWLRPRSA
jgi:ribosomal protein S18 acetylase RimI-like enzyme